MNGVSAPCIVEIEGDSKCAVNDISHEGHAKTSLNAHQKGEKFVKGVRLAVSDKKGRQTRAVPLLGRRDSQVANFS